MKKARIFLVVIGCFCAMAVFSGCDQLKAVKKAIVEYYKGGGEQKEETSKQAQPITEEIKKMTPDTVAKIGNWSITINEFNDRLNAIKEVAPEFNVDDVESKKMILDELINQQVFVEEAQKTGLTKDKDIIAAIEEFRRTLLVREMARRQVQGLSVSDDEIEKFYDENKNSLISPYDYRVSEIVVDSNEKAKEILQLIKDGGDFAELAVKNSIVASAANGGDLGFIKEEPFPEMVTAITSLEQGGVSDVFKGPEGFYIIKLTEKKGGKNFTLDEIKEDLRQELLLLKQKQAIVDYLNKLKEKIKIEKNEALL